MNRLEYSAAVLKPNDQFTILLLEDELKAEKMLKEYFKDKLEHTKDRLKSCQTELEHKNANARDDQRRIADQARTIAEQNPTKWCLGLIIAVLWGFMWYVSIANTQAFKEADAAMLALSEEHTKIYKDVSAAMIKARVYILACKASGFQPEGDSNE